MMKVFVCVLLLWEVTSAYHQSNTSILKLRGGEAFLDDVETQCGTADHKEPDSYKNLAEKDLMADNNPNVIEINPSFLDEKNSQDETVKATSQDQSLKSSKTVESTQSSGPKVVAALDQNKKYQKHHQRVEETARSPDGVAFVPKADKSDMEPIDRKINNGLRDRFSDASISLQRLLESQKPIAVNFANEVKGRYGETASKINAMKSVTFQRLQGFDTTSVRTSITHNAFHAKNRMSDASLVAIRSALEYKISEEVKVLLCMFACSLLGASLGFHTFLYFVSVGYGASIAVIACALLVVGNVSKATSHYTYVKPQPLRTHVSQFIRWLQKRQFLSYQTFIPAWLWSGLYG